MGIKEKVELLREQERRQAIKEAQRQQVEELAKNQAAKERQEQIEQERAKLEKQAQQILDDLNRELLEGRGRCRRVEKLDDRDYCDQSRIDLFLEWGKDWDSYICANVTTGSRACGGEVWLGIGEGKTYHPENDNEAVVERFARSFLHPQSHMADRFAAQAKEEEDRRRKAYGP
jgi:hypothetical protein